MSLWKLPVVHERSRCFDSHRHTLTLISACLRLSAPALDIHYTSARPQRTTLGSEVGRIRLLFTIWHFRNMRAESRVFACAHMHACVHVPVSNLTFWSNKLQYSLWRGCLFERWLNGVRGNHVRVFSGVSFCGKKKKKRRFKTGVALSGGGHYILFHAVSFWYKLLHKEGNLSHKKHAHTSRSAAVSQHAENRQAILSLGTDP